MDLFLEAIAHLSEVVAILAAIKQAEKTGAGTVTVPPIYVHHHASTWKLSITGERTTEPPPKP